MEFGERFEVLFGSDVINDGVYLEAREKATGGVVLMAFYSDADGALTFEQYCDDVPASFVEWFRSVSRMRLPPSAFRTRF